MRSPTIRRIACPTSSCCFSSNAITSLILSKSFRRRVRGSTVIGWGRGFIGCWRRGGDRLVGLGWVCFGVGGGGIRDFERWFGVGGFVLYPGNFGFEI